MKENVDDLRDPLNHSALQGQELEAPAAAAELDPPAPFLMSGCQTPGPYYTYEHFSSHTTSDTWVERTECSEQSYTIMPPAPRACPNHWTSLLPSLPIPALSPVLAN